MKKKAHEEIIFHYVLPVYECDDVCAYSQKTVLPHYEHQQQPTQHGNYLTERIFETKIKMVNNKGKKRRRNKNTKEQKNPMVMNDPY